LALEVWDCWEHIMKLLSGLLTAGVTLSIIAPSAALAQAKPSNAQKLQTQAVAEIPHCARKLGTLSIMDGDDTRGWMQYNLASPQKLLKAMVQKSGCFNLVDRGAGLNAAQIERNIGGNLGLQRGSNVGQGQVKAADYVLVAEVQASDSNAGGGAVAGALGGLIGGRVGGLVGGIKTKKLEANTVLSLTNVRTTETMAVQEGYAAKNDIGWGAGGGWASAARSAAATRTPRSAGSSPCRSSTATPSWSPTWACCRRRPRPPPPRRPRPSWPRRVTNMRATAAAGGKLIRALPAGAIVYPTGEKNGLWWEVADENDNVGWVLNTGLEPAR
jgi:hypothetical protein